MDEATVRDTFATPTLRSQPHLIRSCSAENAASVSNGKTQPASTKKGSMVCTLPGLDDAQVPVPLAIRYMTTAASMVPRSIPNPCTKLHMASKRVLEDCSKHRCRCPIVHALMYPIAMRLNSPPKQGTTPCRLQLNSRARDSVVCSRYSHQFLVPQVSSCRLISRSLRRTWRMFRHLIRVLISVLKRYSAMASHRS